MDWSRLEWKETDPKQHPYTFFSYNITSVNT